MPATPSISVTLISSTTVEVYVTAGADTSHIQFDRSWVDNGGGTNDFEIALSSGSSTYQYFSAPQSAGSYTVSARARISSTASSWVSRGFTVTPPADPDPSVQSLSVSGTGTISATWTIANASYIRPGNSIAIYMSGANNSTQHFMGYYDAGTRSFSRGVSGDGSALAVGASYTVWVYVYDTDGNSFGANRTVSFSKPRPTNFSWTSSKTANGTYNLTAVEWGSFLDCINEFRAYKGLVTRNFSRTVSGTGAISGYVVPSATSYNAAINAINDMNPSVSTPSAVGSGQRVTANHFTRIRDALNSIT